jgi:cytochrome c-type biogenesis protein CcmH/NrfF
MMRTIAAMAIVVLLATPAMASPEDVANDVSSSVMSPFCKGVTLHDCPSAAAADLRDRIEGWAQQGWSKERIVNELEREYGSRIRATPAPQGLGLVAWLLPVALVGAGLLVAATVARRWIGKPRPQAPDLTGEEHSRIEGELAALREAP